MILFHPLSHFFKLLLHSSISSTLQTFFNSLHSQLLTFRAWLSQSPQSGLTCHHFFTAAAAKSLQSCPTLCDPIDGSPPGSPISGILQARTLEWVAMSFSSAWKWKVKGKSLSHVRLLATPWTTAYQAPPSMGFSRQEYWSGVPLPSPISLLLPVVMDELSHFYLRIASLFVGYISLFFPKWEGYVFSNSLLLLL